MKRNTFNFECLWFCQKKYSWNPFIFSCQKNDQFLYCHYEWEPNFIGGLKQYAQKLKSGFYFTDSLMWNDKLLLQWCVIHYYWLRVRAKNPRIKTVFRNLSGFRNLVWGLPIIPMNISTNITHSTLCTYFHLELYFPCNITSFSLYRKHPQTFLFLTYWNDNNYKLQV